MSWACRRSRRVSSLPLCRSMRVRGGQRSGKRRGSSRVIICAAYEYIGPYHTHGVASSEPSVVTQSGVERFRSPGDRGWALGEVWLLKNQRSVTSRFQWEGTPSCMWCAWVLGHFIEGDGRRLKGSLLETDPSGQLKHYPLTFVCSQCKTFNSSASWT